ncbi:MAG: M12 family metallo-peptidase [Methanosarcinales archaeon]|nr:M12 family metallo-peptidase [Methanosarcinales archaeon]
MDLNGDGYIEMGEENYYETPPGEVTYFLDIFAVADQEYRDYYWQPFNTDNFKDKIYTGVDGASVYFMEEFRIKLKVVEISDNVWDSANAKDIEMMYFLLEDVNDEYSWDNNKRNADTLIAFTGKEPDYEGMAFSDSFAVQIPELSDPRIKEMWEPLKYINYEIFTMKYDRKIQKFWMHRLIQHEASHLFGAYDYGLENPAYHKQDNITGEKLARIHSVMDKTKPTEDWDGFKADPTGNILLCNEWNEESIQIINASKTEVTNGIYKIPI